MPGLFCSQFAYKTAGDTNILDLSVKLHAITSYASLYQVTVNGAMKETFAAAGVPNIMNFTFYPWGNAYFNTTTCGTDGFDKQNGMYCWIKECGVASPPADCFKGKKWCQHGGDECQADTIEGCVIKHYPDPATYMKFMVCFEGEHEAKVIVTNVCLFVNVRHL
jgi:hypothetical protein